MGWKAVGLGLGEVFAEKRGPKSARRDRLCPTPFYSSGVPAAVIAVELSSVRVAGEENTAVVTSTQKDCIWKALQALFQ